MNARRSLALVCLLSALLLVGCGGELPTTSKQATPVKVTMLVMRVQPEVADSFKVGQEVRSKTTGALIGTITSVDATLAVLPLGDSEGNLHAARSPIQRDVVLTLEGEAVVSDTGFVFDGSTQYINEELVFLTPYTQFLGFITGMERVGS